MRQSDLTEVWDETLERMRACFDFSTAVEKPQKSSDESKRAASFKRDASSERSTAKASVGKTSGGKTSVGAQASVEAVAA